MAFQRRRCLLSAPVPLAPPLLLRHPYFFFFSVLSSIFCSHSFWFMKSEPRNGGTGNRNSVAGGPSHEDSADDGWLDCHSRTTLFRTDFHFPRDACVTDSEPPSRRAATPRKLSTGLLLSAPRSRATRAEQLPIGEPSVRPPFCGHEFVCNLQPTRSATIETFDSRARYSSDLTRKSTALSNPS